MIVNRTVRQGDSADTVIEAVGMLISAMNRRHGKAIETTSDYVVQAEDELIIIPSTGAADLTITLPPYDRTSLPRWIISQSAGIVVTVQASGATLCTLETALGYVCHYWPTTNAWVRLI